MEIEAIVWPWIYRNERSEEIAKENSMCGIVGFVDKKNALSFEEKEFLIQKMIQSVKHRGQDGAGYIIEGNVVMGHTRLSIIDLSERANQPFFNEKRSLFLSYNGEIYNYKKIKNSFLSHRIFRTDSDTEVLLQAYQEYGSRALTKFKGMFAFSLFDKMSSSILLAVDRFFIKPLYYFDNEDWFVWGSEIKSLFLLPIPKKINTSKIYEQILFRNIAGSQTLFEGVHSFLPAEQVVFDVSDGSLHKSRYWSVGDRMEEAGDMGNEKLLLEKLEHSIRDHLVADVPVGFQLSGGVDSSLITALTAQKNDQPIHTFSIGLEDDAWNEFRYSRMISEQFETVHHELTFTEYDFCTLLPKLTYHHDEPIAHSHSIPMYMLSIRAHDYVRVLMSGEGADEVFGGYRRYQRIADAECMEKEDIILLSSFPNQQEAQQVCAAPRGEWLSERSKIFDSFQNSSLLGQVSWLDIQTYLQSLLVRQDKMSMAATVEGRVPFLDHELVAFGLSLPDHMKVDTFETKILLKRVASSFLPHELVYRKKCGFGQPIAKWLRNENGLGKYLKLFESPAIKRDFFHYEVIGAMIKEHKKGRKDYSEVLWSILNIEIWAKIFFDGDDPDTIWGSL